MDIGFSDAGFEVVWANDHNQDACDTYRRQIGAEVVCADVATMSPSGMPDTDIIIGGFPCQGFSFAGNRKLDDSRNVLYRHLVRCVGDKKPIAFVAENVTGLLTIGGSDRTMRMIIKAFESKGYVVNWEILNACRMGVPQERKRVFIVGIRRDIGIEPTLPDHDDVKTTMKDVLWGLPEPDHDDVFWGSFSSQFMSRNRWRGWDEPSFTVIAKPDKAPLHPSSPPMIQVSKEQWKFGAGKTRRMSWREVAMIQTFPKGMEFSGSLSSKYHQIGNAVPCKLAERVAANLIRDLAGKGRKSLFS